MSQNSHDPDIAEDGTVTKELLKGGFLIPEDLDELDGIRTNHYSARFGASGRGLTIIPTLRCNFSCDYCYEDPSQRDYRDNGLTIMSEAVCQNIVHYCEETLAQKSALTVTWYGGEPMLARDVVVSLSRDLIEVCRSKECQYVAGMITNGYLLDPSNIELLKQARISFFQITVDGPRDIHDQRRPLLSGGPTYERIVENLAHMSECEHFRVSLRINVDGRNKDHIGDLLVDLRSRGFHLKQNVSVYFSQVVQNTNACPDISGQCLPTPSFASWMVDAYREALRLGFRITLYPAVQIGTCGAVGKASAVIEPDGSVQSCWNTVGNATMQTGRLSSHGIEPNPAQLRWLGWSAFRPECQSCNVLPLCMGGCPYMSLFKDKFRDVTQGSCIWWKHNLAEMLQVLREARSQNLLDVRRAQAGKEGLP